MIGSLQDLLRRAWRHPSGRWGGLCLLVLALVAVAAPPFLASPIEMPDVVAGATARHDGSLAEQTFEGGGRRGEAAVEITRLGGELAQAADGNGVGPGRRVAGWKIEIGIGIGIAVILAGQTLGRSGEGGG